jgi:hypothetical protein
MFLIQAINETLIWLFCLFAANLVNKINTDSIFESIIAFLQYSFLSFLNMLLKQLNGYNIKHYNTSYNYILT